VLGYSGSGKTHLILNAMRLLKKHLSYNLAVIKYIHEHKIDKKGKDSYRFGEEGAIFSITRNSSYETTIFLKKELSIEKLVKWLELSPYKIDLIFTESFRGLSYPSILCVNNSEDIESQLEENTLMISGLIIKKKDYNSIHSNLPIFDITEDFQKFLTLFKITE